MLELYVKRILDSKDILHNAQKKQGVAMRVGKKGGSAAAQRVFEAGDRKRRIPGLAGRELSAAALLLPAIIPSVRGWPGSPTGLRCC
jgi:hypothetical protein